ncbi:Lens fiber membrane intrinsic protein, partial [Ophiophagus hannah]
MSLSTSYWVLETTHRGMVHGGLWDICLESKCNLYQFNLLALHIHVTRAFLLMALFCGFMGLLFSCISFERNKLYDVSVIKVAAIFSFSAGFLVLVAMSLFTTILRKSPGYAQRLVIFGSSFSLGWVSILMYIITGETISTISVYSQTNFRFLMQPLWFSSLIFCTASLMLMLIALFTPYWVIESTPHGLLHGGLWSICLDPNCDFYPINLGALLMKTHRILFQ